MLFKEIHPGLVEYIASQVVKHLDLEQEGIL